MLFFFIYLFIYLLHFILFYFIYFVIFVCFDFVLSVVLQSHILILSLIFSFFSSFAHYSTSCFGHFVFISSVFTFVRPVAFWFLFPLLLSLLCRLLITFISSSSHIHFLPLFHVSLIPSVLITQSSRIHYFMSPWSPSSSSPIYLLSVSSPPDGEQRKGAPRWKVKLYVVAPISPSSISP